MLIFKYPAIRFFDRLSLVDSIIFLIELYKIINSGSHRFDAHKFPSAMPPMACFFSICFIFRIRGQISADEFVHEVNYILLYTAFETVTWNTRC